MFYRVPNYVQGFNTINTSLLLFFCSSRSTSQSAAGLEIVLLHHTAGVDRWTSRYGRLHRRRRLHLPPQPQQRFAVDVRRTSPRLRRADDDGPAIDGGGVRREALPGRAGPDDGRREMVERGENEDGRAGSNPDSK